MAQGLSLQRAEGEKQVGPPGRQTVQGTQVLSLR